MRKAWQGLLATCGLVLAGCAQQDEKSAAALDFTAPLPAVAAQFRTTISSNGTEQSFEWRFWRNDRRVVIEHPAQRTGSEWQRDGSVIFHRQLFHGEQRGIEMQLDDVPAADRTSTWMQRALLIDPQLLGALHDRGTHTKGGHTLRRYEGGVYGVNWRVQLRADTLVPVLIERREADVVERIELLALHPLSQAPWQPTPAGNYQFIDHIDLGDMGYDPFVQKVQRYGAVAHTH